MNKKSLRKEVISYISLFIVSIIQLLIITAHGNINYLGEVITYSGGIEAHPFKYANIYNDYENGTITLTEYEMRLDDLKDNIDKTLVKIKYLDNPIVRTDFYKRQLNIIEKYSQKFYDELNEVEGKDRQEVMEKLDFMIINYNYELEGGRTLQNMFDNYEKRVFLPTNTFIGDF